MPGKHSRVITINKQVNYNYFIEKEYEVGIVLLGSEVKSIRLGKINIRDAYAFEREEEIFMHNFIVEKYNKASYFDHEPKREKKLLLHKSEIKKILGLISKKGMTLAISKLYFNEKNRIKATLAVVRGKKLHDKRQSIKEREWSRQKQQILKRNI